MKVTLKVKKKKDNIFIHLPFNITTSPWENYVDVVNMTYLVITYMINTAHMA